MKKIRYIILSLVLLLPLSCNVDSEYSTKYSCYLLFYTQYHSTSHIISAINPLAPGTFVKISLKRISNITHVYVSGYGLSDEDTSLTTDKENYPYTSGIYLGANNSIIVGCSMYGGLYAFDGQCPNCLANSSYRSYPLSWVSGQEVKCAKCGRTYNLNTGVVASGDAGSQLLKYRATYDGTALIVHN